MHITSKRQFPNLAKENALNSLLCSRYIADQNHVTEALPPVTRWNGEKFVVIPEEVEADKEIPADILTMRELRKMGSSISPMVQLKEDIPSSHEDKNSLSLTFVCGSKRKK